MCSDLSSPIDPFRVWKSRLRGIAIVSAVLLGGAVLWSALPLPADEINPINDLQHLESVIESAKDDSAITEPPIDLALFAVDLCTMPTPTETDEPATESKAPEVDSARKPESLRLIAIVKEGDRYSAAVFDEDDQRIRLLEIGDEIRSLHVAEITHHALELTDGRSRFLLALSHGKRDR